MGIVPMLDLAQLNRATLARQGLLERANVDLPSLLEQVGGIQAQAPTAPPIGLWSRLRGFDASQLVDAAVAGEVVRGTTLRGTLHLHTAADYRTLRPLLQPVLDSQLSGMRGRVREEDVAGALDMGRRLLAERPQMIGELKGKLAARFESSQPQALGNVVRLGEPLLVVPDAERRWGWAANSPFALASDILNKPLATDTSPEWLVRRFLSALGPGSPKDAQTWSGLRGLKAVMQRMHDQGKLIVLTTWEGDELYDLPDAPRPSGETPAGVRFLPMWDNLLLSHADRSRVISPEWRPLLSSHNGMPPPTFLVDGFVHGSWRVVRERDQAVLQLTAFASTSRAMQDALVQEGEALLRFLEPDADQLRVNFG